MRGYIAPVLVLLMLVAAIEGVRHLLPDPAVENASARIGWSAASESDHLARDIYERVNDERVARGLPALVWHDGLAELARQWSEEMLATGYRHSTAQWRSHPDFARYR